ncbi:MAG: hypothetical protein BGP06_07780 [Rhizobiales bacterium 65-9]|nr:four-carbon acid sugar kinase family protein [Hyphomicrobiales bacterium]OJY35695.1 MAG: hypothetical protein BGP06_07780 [Rhizobiales bacterium 65-9]
MRLGVIADDMTGATDVALMLTKSGMRVVQTIGAPGPDWAAPAADAVVIALKSRTIDPADAVSQSLAACRALTAGGASQILFKYCSTFDSTAKGNIGPVADALADALNAPLALVCPAFPEAGRTIFQGHLFVGADPLDESPMKDHPLTPMRDSSLVRLMAAQTQRKVGLIPFATVAKGADAVSAACAALIAEGCRYAVADAVTNDNLLTLGAAAAAHRLVTGGSGIALGLPANFPDTSARGDVRRFEAPSGRAAVLAGSCSTATRAQVAAAQAAGAPNRAIDVGALARGDLTAADLADWALSQSSHAAPLIYSTADPASVADAQKALGVGRAGELVEQTIADTAALLIEGGVRRLIVAGGETSGAVIQRLGVRALEIGPEIAPGVPWTKVIDGPPIAVALKSGNFGGPDFFARALVMLDARS